MKFLTNMFATLLIIFTSFPALADSHFYKNKTITVLIGASAGGGYDVFGRLLARNIGKHISGQPTIVVQNKWGSGSFVAARTAALSLPTDGTVIIGLNKAIALQQIMTGKQLDKFDIRQFNWIGSLDSEVGICAVNDTKHVTSFEQLRKESIVVGGTKSASSSWTPLILSKTNTALIKVILGYRSTREIHMAMARNEVDGICQSYTSYQRIAAKVGTQATFVAYLAIGQHAELANMNIPHIKTFMQPADWELMSLTLVPNAMGRPFAVAPGVPQAQVKMLRQAFNDMLTDPDYKADVARVAKHELKPITGVQVEQLVAKIAQTPRDRLDRLVKLTKKKK